MTQSIVRTLVPIIYALLLRIGAKSLGIDDATLQAAAALIAAGIIYVALRLAEQRWPRVGVLLGWPKAPSYDVVAGTVIKPPAGKP